MGSDCARGNSNKEKGVQWTSEVLGLQPLGFEVGLGTMPAFNKWD